MATSPIHVYSPAHARHPARNISSKHSSGVHLHIVGNRAQEVARQARRWRKWDDHQDSRVAFVEAIVSSTSNNVALSGQKSYRIVKDATSTSPPKLTTSTPRAITAEPITDTDKILLTSSLDNHRQQRRAALRSQVPELTVLPGVRLSSRATVFLVRAALTGIFLLVLPLGVVTSLDNLNSSPTGLTLFLSTSSSLSTFSPIFGGANATSSQGKHAFTSLALQGTPTPVPISSTSGLSLLGPPTLTVSKIETVLQAYHSPAQGKGQTLYDLGIKYGIDPAFALAFFVHESSAGTRGVAVTTMSLGNIRATPGVPSYAGYRQYESWEEGMEDWYRLIRNLYVGQWGLTTVEKIIPVYAPAADHNDEAFYIRSVTGLVNQWRTKNP